MTRGDRIRKWVVYGILLVLLAALNYDVLAALSLPAIPLLLPAAAVAAGVLEGPVFGAGFSLAAGLLMYAAGGSAALVAVVPAIGLVCGLLAQFVLRRDFWGFVPAVLCTMLLWELYEVLSRLATGGAAAGVLLRVTGAEYLWTAAFAAPVYFLCRFCCIHYGRIYYE